MIDFMVHHLVRAIDADRCFVGGIVMYVHE
jgi:hypothetical protein